MFRFKKSDHLLRPAEFRRVFERRRSVSDECLVVYGCENELGRLRLGLSVSRKVGPAVFRNRVRRLYREAFRLMRAIMPSGIDIVLIPRTQQEPTLEALKKSLPNLVRALASKLGREKENVMTRYVLSWVREIVSFLLILPVRFYQTVIGPLLPRMCKFQPSCSEYFIEAVRKHGPVRGTCKGVWRVCRCNPWNRGGYDPP